MRVNITKEKTGLNRYGSRKKAGCLVEPAAIRSAVGEENSFCIFPYFIFFDFRLTPLDICGKYWAMIFCIYGK